MSGFRGSPCTLKDLNFYTISNVFGKSVAFLIKITRFEVLTRWPCRLMSSGMWRHVVKIYGHFRDRRFLCNITTLLSDYMVSYPWRQ